MSEYKSITHFDPVGKIIETTTVSTDGDQVRVERVQNCDQIIDAVKAARDLPRMKTMRHVASIPLTVWMQWMTEAGIKPGTDSTDKQMKEVVRRKLKSGEFDKLKVHGY